MPRLRPRDVLHYKAHGDPFGITQLTERELRRYEFDRIETGERPASFVDLINGAWFIVGANYGGSVLPPAFPGKRLPFGADGLTSLLLEFLYTVRTGLEKGGEIMARSISVNEILKQAEAAQAAYDAAVEQRKNVRKVARTLADAGLLDEDDVAKVEEIFPSRKSKSDAADGGE